MIALILIIVVVGMSILMSGNMTSRYHNQPYYPTYPPQYPSYPVPVVPPMDMNNQYYFHEQQQRRQAGFYTLLFLVLIILGLFYLSSKDNNNNSDDLRDSRYERTHYPQKREVTTRRSYYDTEKQ